MMIGGCAECSHYLLHELLIVTTIALFYFLKLFDVFFTIGMYFFKCTSWLESSRFICSAIVALETALCLVAG